MRDWFKKKKIEQELKKWLASALGDPYLRGVLKVENATFSLASADRYGVKPSDELLIGEYDGKFPTIHGTASDCYVKLGKWKLDSEHEVSLSAWLVSSRVVGFLFSTHTDSFPTKLPKNLKFFSNIELDAALKKTKTIAIECPDWFPDVPAAAVDFEKDFQLPQGYTNNCLSELFQWYSSLDVKGVLLERPDVDSEINLHDEVFLLLGHDQCGNAMVLGRSPNSKLFIVDHSNLSFQTIEGGIKAFFGKN